MCMCSQRADITLPDTHECIGDEKAEKISSITDTLNLTDTLNSALLAVIDKKLQATMPTMVNEKFKEKGVEVECYSCTQKEQAEFLLKTLKDID
jgi:hypothetical protein